MSSCSPHSLCFHICNRQNRKGFTQRPDAESFMRLQAKKDLLFLNKCIILQSGHVFYEQIVHTQGQTSETHKTV